MVTTAHHRRLPVVILNIDKLRGSTGNRLKTLSQDPAMPLAAREIASCDDGSPAAGRMVTLTHSQVDSMIKTPASTNGHLPEMQVSSGRTIDYRSNRG